jgi:hypothetical protein
MAKRAGCAKARGQKEELGQGQCGVTLGVEVQADTSWLLEHQNQIFCGKDHRDTQPTQGSCA